MGATDVSRGLLCCTQWFLLFLALSNVHGLQLLGDAADQSTVNILFIVLSLPRPPALTRVPSMLPLLSGLSTPASQPQERDAGQLFPGREGDATGTGFPNPYLFPDKVSKVYFYGCI